VGLITSLLLLPVAAPARGFAWVASVIADEADRQMAESASPSRGLEELAAAAANGEISQEEAEAREAEIIQRMLAAHDPAEGA
jgi:hypothetical protein